MARKLQQNETHGFWKEARLTNSSKLPLPSDISGISGSENVAELWRNQNCDISDCVSGNCLILGAVP